MPISISECPLGIYAFNENKEIIDSEEFPSDTRKIAKKLSQIRDEKPTGEHISLIQRLSEKNQDKFILGSTDLTSKLEKKFEDLNFEVKVPSPADEKLRKSLRELVKKSDHENTNKLLRDVNISITRKDLRQEASERDKIVIESINTIDEIDKTTNTLYGKIKEWYGIHFPELERHISEHSDYFKLISELGRRKNFTKDNLLELGLSEEKAEKIQETAENSIGANFDEFDIEAIQASVRKIKNLQEAREKISEYLDGLMEQVAPNMRTLIGSPIGARLISLAGGLEELAKLPSSTIQVLGAEKALFRSLHKDAKPPKHGVIFQYPEIRGSPKSLRGKIARALAGKAAIAARVDAMSGKYVGDELKEELEERIESIKSER